MTSASLTWFEPLSGALTPAYGLQMLALKAGWMLVLAALAAYALRPFPMRLRLAGVVAAAIACWLPGEWSPGWWLGLAFQTPSLTLQGLCGLYLFRVWRLRAVAPVDAQASTTYARWPNGLLLFAALAGWLLLLDMLAAFEIHGYWIGFPPYAVLANLLVAALFELISMRSGHAPQLQKYRDVSAIVLLAMLVLLLTRLPTGNAWDAVMDPWLWLAAQATLLSRAAVWATLAVRAKLRNFRTSTLFNR